VGFASLLLEIGISNDVEGLKSLQASLSTLSSLVYEGHNVDLGLEHVISISNREILELMLENSTMKNIVGKVSKLVVPYITQLPDGIQLFHEYLVGRAVDGLDLCVSLFERRIWSPTEVEFAKLVLDCSYASSPLNCKDYDSCLFRILNCIPLITFDDDSKSGSPTDGWDDDFDIPGEYEPVDRSVVDLKSRLDLLTRHIRAWEIFSIYTIILPLEWFSRIQSLTSQQGMLSRLVGLGGGSMIFLERMFELVKLGTFPLLIEDDIFIEVVSSALNSAGTSVCFLF
jgi:hypothetical protein